MKQMTLLERVDKARSLSYHAEIRLKAHDHLGKISIGLLGIASMLTQWDVVTAALAMFCIYFVEFNPRLRAKKYHERQLSLLNVYDEGIFAKTLGLYPNTKPIDLRLYLVNTRGKVKDKMNLYLLCIKEFLIHIASCSLAIWSFV